MILFLDYETFWDTKDGYTLKKMTTTEYLNDPRFKVHGAHVAIDEGKSQWVTARLLREFFGDMRQHVTHMCAFNGRFDHAITAQFYMPEEKFLLDPMSMAQGALSTQYPDLGMSLDALLKFAFPNNPEWWKVHGVLETTDGIRDLPAHMEANLAQYAGVDNDGARRLFKWLLTHGYPWGTALIDIHLTLAMAVYPQLQMDTLRAAAIHRAELREKDEAAAKINVSRAMLRSSHTFAHLLRQAGCEPPVKLNAKNELAYAFASKDEDFKALADHDNPTVRALYEARIGEKSSQPLSRSARFARLPENLPVPTRYAAAHTGRHGGEEFNMQNLKRGHALRACVKARLGHKVLVRDLSQIELRMNAWWCEEHWLTDLLRAGGDPYCLLATKIYGRTITKADDAERFVGKQGELSCGYQSGWMKAMSALRSKDVPADEKLAKAVVYGYRDTHPAIVAMWKTLQETALPVIAGYGQPFEHKGVQFEHGYVRLPSGRKLWYPELKVNEDGDWVFRVNPRRNKGGKWKKIFGGALLENCIAAGSLVLTANGWKPIENISDCDLVHDGVEFVSHGGLLCKSVQPCVSIDGVWMTPDHKVMTNDGWKEAAAVDMRHHRVHIRLPYSCRSIAQRWQEDALGLRVCMWCKGGKDWIGRNKICKTWTLAELRMYGEAWINDPWDVFTSSLLGVAQHARQVSATITPGVEKLRRAWHHSVRQVAGFFGFLGGHGTNIQLGVDTRPGKQQRRVLPGELPLGKLQGTIHEPEELTFCEHPKDICGDWNFEVDPVLQVQPWSVFDIRNAGPRHRFVVMGRNGPIIVHNCIQAMSYDVFMMHARMAWHAGYRMAMAVHDEMGFSVPEHIVEKVDALIASIQRVPAPWCADIPLKGEGGWGDNYLEAK